MRLPAGGTLSTGTLSVGNSTTGIGRLFLNGATVTVTGTAANAVLLGDGTQAAGTDLIDIGVTGMGGGLTLSGSATNALTVGNSGRIAVAFNADPTGSDSNGWYYGVRWAGNNLAALNTLSGTGRLTISGSGLSPALQQAGYLSYDAAADQTYVGLTVFGTPLALDLANVTDQTLRLNGVDRSIGSLSGTAGSLQLGGGTLTMGSNNGSTTLAAAVSGNGGLTKTGSGTLSFSGTHTFGSGGSGRLTVLGGTVVAAGNAPDQGSGVFGAQASLRPLVGAVDATGTAALLVNAGFTVSRPVEIASAGTGTQEAILGGLGVGTTTFDNLSAVYLGRSALTLAADSGNTALFYNAWLDGSGGGSPAAAFNVGTSLLSGTVGLMSFVPDSITAVNVRNGTLRLAASGGYTLGVATQVTVGSGLGSATLDLANAQQSLASLSFSGSAGTVVGGGAGGGAGGVLQFSNNGAAAAVAVLDGTGHDIQSAVELLDATTFNVAGGGRLGVSGAISGGSGLTLTKTGLGRLDLTGANSYTGNTTVSAGVLAVNGSLAAASTVTVASGGVLGGTGLIAGSVVGTGGLIAPGASPGILTVQGNLAASGSTAFKFEFSGTGNPTWSNAAASVNDVLRLTNPSPFTSPLSASNVVNIYFDVVSLTAGNTFRGGFYVDNPLSTGSLLDTGIGSATFEYFVLGDGQGTVSYNNTDYYSLADYSSTLGVTRSVVNVASADFAGGTVTTGQVTEFVVIVVPEPGGLALAGVGVALAVWTLRRRRR